MKINDDHMYHGAALTQIAEHESFTSINAFRIQGQTSRSAFRVNETIGVYLKYASKPGTASDYSFTFTEANKEELLSLVAVCEHLYLVLITIKHRQICCISYIEFTRWLERRTTAAGEEEALTTLLVKAPPNKSFRVNMNRPGRRGLYLGKAQLVAQKRFPNVLFE